ncbi:MAG: succinate dehydrogenase, hydrophobic membrane anchor protein [Hyphomonadaceae bacterium]|nr:succinate dehydrogenase, hydrophobic membrane anchor protein [Hyphomonadaceae bacterium]
MSKQRAMRSALGRVRNHGAAGEGTGHFIAQRVSSIALAILAPWFVVSAALALRDGAYASVIDFLTYPVNAVGVVLLLVAGLWHMMLGMQEVIVDYIHKPSSKIVLLLLNAFVPLALGAGAVFAVLLINFGA